MVTTSKLTWIRFSGTPFHLWVKQCFAKIVCSYGTFVALDEDMTNLCRLNYACILINGKRYQMKVVEETCPQATQCLCWLWKVGLASREGSTIENNVGMHLLSSQSECSSDWPWCEEEEIKETR